MAGCVASGPRGRFLQEVAPESVANLTAYRTNNSIEIIYPLGGEHAVAHAVWTSVTNGSAGYEYQSAVLTFQKTKRAERKATVKPGNRIFIRDAKQWQQLLNRVFAALAPKAPGHGKLLLVQYMELVAYRDAAGAVKVVKLENKPPDIVVDHTFTEEEFAQAAIRQLEANAGALDTNQSQFLFLTGETPSYVLVDVRQKLLVFLSYPADPDAGPTEIPGAFALRALNSILIKSLAITAIKNPFTLVGRGLWHLGNSGATMLDTAPGDPARPPPPLYTGPGMDLATWEKELDGMVSARRYRGRVQPLIDGEQYFPALIQSIESAKKSVDVMVYIFGADDFAIRIADVLKERSSAVRVRVLMDDLGSLFAGEVLSKGAKPPDYPRPADIKSYLASHSRVKVRASADPWLSTDHRKCVIIDDQQAYVGGMNIAYVYRYQWHDLMLSLTGPIVGRLQKDYDKAWEFSGPFGDFAYAWATLFDREHLANHRVEDGIQIRPLRTSTGELQIYHAQLAAIRRAKRYIYIENAYFNDNSILRELILARQRGVDVRVVLPSENDIGIMQFSNLLMANEMIRNGIRVYAYPGMTHVKAAIYDGWACVGSANFEKMSLKISQELDVAYSDPTAVGRLRQALFEKDFQSSRELKTPVAPDWLDSVVKAFADEL